MEEFDPSLYNGLNKKNIELMFLDLLASEEANKETLKYVIASGDWRKTQHMDLWVPVKHLSASEVAQLYSSLGTT